MSSPPTQAIRRQFVSQPQFPVLIDRSNPICRGLSFAWTPITGAEHCTMGQLSMTGYAVPWHTYQAFEAGIALDADQGGFEFQAPSRVVGDQSYVVVGNPPGVIKTWNILLDNEIGGLRMYFGEYAITTNTGIVRFATSDRWPTGCPTVVSWSDNARSDYGMWVNGSSVANIGNMSGDIYGASGVGQLFQGGAGDRSAHTYWDAPIALVLQFGRLLTTEEKISLTRNPWQVFTPITRHIAISAAAALIRQRALVWSSSNLAQVTPAQEGTGMKPIVLFNGSMQQRVADEGAPVIWDGSTLRTLDVVTEELAI